MIRQGAVLASAACSRGESSSDAVMRTAFGHSLSIASYRTSTVLHSDPTPSTGTRVKIPCGFPRQ